LTITIIASPSSKSIGTKQSNFYVARYYRKQDLEKRFPSLMSIISENEVFLTNLKDFIEVETIMSEASVITFEEYDKLTNITPGTFFSRFF
jgi:hypothetical protein